MEKRELICIMCPNGCLLSVDENLNVTGNKCLRGVSYAKDELTHPTRVVTSTAKIDSKILAVCPLKTKDPIPKEMIFDVMKEINKLHLVPPVRMGQVLIENVLGTGVDVVSCRDILA